MRLLIALLFTSLATGASAQNIQRINPKSLPPPPGYSHVVTVAPGTKLVYVAGQVPVDSVGRLSRDFKAQLHQALKNVRTALAAANGDFRNVVKITWYVAGLTEAELTAIQEVRKDYLPEDALPASTIIGVQTLFHPAVRIEIEVVAAVPA